MQIVDAEVPKSFRLDRVGVADPTTWNAKATCRGMQRLLQTLEELAGRTDRTVQQQAASLLKEGIRIPSTTRLEGKAVAGEQCRTTCRGKPNKVAL